MISLLHIERVDVGIAIEKEADVNALDENGCTALT